MLGYVNRGKDRFLQEHADRFPPMGKLGPPYTAATVVNNIFRCAQRLPPPSRSSVAAGSYGLSPGHLGSRLKFKLSLPLLTPCNFLISHRRWSYRYVT